jgi:SPP1 family predicted phage head-tail adaptor
MPGASGRRDREIVFERAAVTKSPMGAERPSWTEHCRALAEVRWGSGAERRAAAQERATVPATFRVLRSPTTAGLTAADRIIFEGLPWDITSVVPWGRHEIDITATRAA